MFVKSFLRRLALPFCILMDKYKLLYFIESLYYYTYLIQIQNWLSIISLVTFFIGWQPLHFRKWNHNFWHQSVREFTKQIKKILFEDRISVKRHSLNYIFRNYAQICFGFCFLLNIWCSNDCDYLLLTKLKKC